MSFLNILNKLAEKKAIQGDSDFAYRLISVSEKLEEEEEKKAEMIKRGKDRKKVASKELWLEAYEELLMEYIEKFMERGLEEDEAEMAAEEYLDKNSHLVDERAGDFEARAIDRAMNMYGDTYASTLSKMIKKYAGKSKEGSYEDAIMNLPGFTGTFGNGFCFMTKEQAQKALAIGEQAANFLDWAVERHDDGFMAISRGRDKKASALDLMIKKYAGQDSFHQDADLPGEIFGEEEPFDPLTEDDYFEAMGNGFEAGMRDPEVKKNPYNPVDHDDQLVVAWNAGYDSALRELSSRGTKL